jgi:hypothetical protein
MREKTCVHRWEMINIQPGFIITENCFRCKKTSTYFSLDERPPLEEYREGEHFWNVMESAQSFRFDLKCTSCGKMVTLAELSGLMMCTGCDDKCEVDKLIKKMEKDRTWIYVAFGFFPVSERKQLSEEKITILEEYFNQRRKSTTSRIKIVSSAMIPNLATCFAEVIKDVGKLSLTPPENE